MRIILERALFDARSPEEAGSLIRLLTSDALDTDIHALVTDPPYIPGADNGPIDDWFERRGPSEAAVFRSLLSNGLLRYQGTRASGAFDLKRSPRRWHMESSLTIRVSRRPESDWRARELNLTDAVALLQESTHLVLENERTDLAFLRHLAGPTNGEALRSLLERPGRVHVHGGGTGFIKNWLKEHLECPPNPVTWRLLWRTWILFDKDTGDADVLEHSRAAKDLLDLCEKIVSAHGGGLSWVCLQRREIESYVPDDGLSAEALDRHKDFAARVVEWRGDSVWESHAWALDLKKGLRGDLHDKVLKEERDAIKAGPGRLEARMLKKPFSDLSQAEITLLETGMGDRLSEALVRTVPAPAWAAGFPAEYDRGPVEQAGRAELVQSLFDRM